MRKIKKWLLILILFSFSIAGDYASIAKRAGWSGAKFLDLPVGAENIALNFSGQSMVFNAPSLTFNPAVISLIEKDQFYLSHSFWFQAISYDFIGYIFRWTKVSGRFGMGMKFYKTDDIGHTIDSIQIIDYFRATASVLYAAYSDYINKKLIYGVTGLLFKEGIFNKNSYGIALNLGILYMPPREELLLPDFQKNLVPRRISIAVNNVGYKTAFLEESDIMPMKIQCAFYYRLFDKVDWSWGLLLPIDNKLSIGSGWSYVVKNILKLNLSYEYSLGGNDHGFLQGIASGFSVNVQNYGIEYAFKYYKYLGITNHLSVYMSF